MSDENKPSEMSDPDSTEESPPPKKYHQHPLFPDLPLTEAVQRGLAVPVEPNYNDIVLRKRGHRSKATQMTQSMEDRAQGVVTTPSETDDPAPVSNRT